VTFDEHLAVRIRSLVEASAGLSETKVFGGIAFLANGNMAVAASGNGGIVVRVAPDRSADLVATTEARMMKMRGKTMHGWLRIDAAHVESDEALATWVDLGISYAASLPAKPTT